MRSSQNTIENLNQMRSTRSTDALNTSSTSRYWPVGNCNVVLVGDAKVGKTNLVNRATQDKFNEVRHSLNFFLISMKFGWIIEFHCLNHFTEIFKISLKCMSRINEYGHMWYFNVISTEWTIKHTVDRNRHNATIAITKIITPAQLVLLRYRTSKNHVMPALVLFCLKTKYLMYIHFMLSDKLNYFLSFIFYGYSWYCMPMFVKWLIHIL